MNKTISPRLTMLCVGLALLLSAACKPKADKSVMGGGAASTSPAASTSQPASTGQPGQAPATTIAGHTPTSAPDSTSSAAPGSPKPAAGNPMGSPAGNPGAEPQEQAMSPEKLPAIVARVNGKPVKREELIQGAQVMLVQLAQRGQRVVPTAAFYRRVLDDLVAFTLIQQDAKAQGVTASPQEVQQQIDSRKRAFPNEAAYKAALAKAGMTEAILREEAGNQIVVQRFLETKVASQVSVSEQTARQFYDKNQSSMSAPERLHIRQIVVQVAKSAPEADKAKAKAKAEEAYKKIQAGEDFAKLVPQYSDDPGGSKTRGGDVGWIVAGQTVPEFEKAAFALKKPNEVSPPTETREGYHIIQLVERQAAGVIPFDQVKDRLMTMMKQQQVQKVLQTRAEELRSKAKVEVYI